MNRFERRKARRQIKQSLKGLTGEAKSAWDNLLAECGGDRAIAEGAIVDLMNRDIQSIEAKKNKGEA